jgi:hypothetical protein
MFQTKVVQKIKTENIKGPITLISLKYTQNWLKVQQTVTHAALHIVILVCTRLYRGKMHSDWFHGVEIV